MTQVSKTTVTRSTFLKGMLGIAVSTVVAPVVANAHVGLHTQPDRPTFLENGAKPSDGSRDLSVLHDLGSFGRSFRENSAPLTRTGDLSLRTVFAKFREPIRFAQNISSNDGSPLSGTHALTLSPDGSWDWTGEVHAATDAPFAIQITATVFLLSTQPTPDGGWVKIPRLLALRHETKLPAPRAATTGEDHWSHTGSHHLIKHHWPEIHSAQPWQLTKQHQPRTSPGALSIQEILTEYGTNIGAAATSYAITMLRNEDTAHQNPPQNPNMRSTIVQHGDDTFLTSPTGLVVVRTPADRGTAIETEQSTLTAVETDFATKIFGRSIDCTRIVKTNLLSAARKPCTVALDDGRIAINLGRGFTNPTKYRGAGTEDQGAALRPGTLLVHQLMHAWQIQHGDPSHEHYCVGFRNRDYPYTTGVHLYPNTPWAPWASFTTEQQACIVEDWYCGIDNGKLEGIQKIYQPQENDPDVSPWYELLRNNVFSP